MNERKLLLHERVEVRQFEDGLRGSWHAGVVVGVSESFRSVEYDELLCETGPSKLIESIPVTEAIEGVHRRRHIQSNYRGCIRPLYPHESDASNSKLGFGICVDAFHNDAWWEGVIFDFDMESNERLIYFPDEGDECRFSVNNLRVSREWDEFLGVWRDRGLWVLVELALNINTSDPPHFIKIVWATLRSEYEFVKMVSEWTCGVQSLWDHCFQGVVCEIPTVFRGKQMLGQGRSRSKNSTHRCKAKPRHVVDGSEAGTASSPDSLLAQHNRSYSRMKNFVKPKQINGKRATEKIQQGITKTRRPNEEEIEFSDASQQQDVECIDALSLDKSKQMASLKEKSFYPMNHKRKREYPSLCTMDTICSVCHYGEDVIPCNNCLSSFHLRCIDLKDVPDGKWFCPSCRCGLCGLRDPNDDSEVFTNTCNQCGHQYHVDCLNRAGCFFSKYDPFSEFCSVKCSELSGHLHRLVGTSNPTSVEGITWTLMKRMVNDCGLQSEVKGDIRRKLSVALSVITECFQPVFDPHTKRNTLVNVTLSTWSKWRRSDFHGFYVMALQKGDDFTCVAAVRIHGPKVAEMPLVATNFEYRHQGMCRLLVQELEKLLNDMGVERLTLPAVSQLRETWVNSFGFEEIPPSQRVELACYPLLGFQGTTMFQKFLPKYMEIRKTRGAHQTYNGSNSSLSQEQVMSANKQQTLSGLYCQRKANTKSLGKENN